jgi:RNA polymerase sigma factor (sigma-70 family)
VIAPSEDAVGTQARAGDKAAFEALVRREKAGLYSFVRRYIGDPDEAYDIVQDSFIAAWRSIRSYDPARPFAVWIRTIALNKCRDYGRRAAVRRALKRAFAAEPASPPEPAETNNRADEQLRRLDRAIAALPAAYKEPLLLTTAGGLSQAQAAEVLKTTPKGIEMKLRRARVRLAELLAKPAEG